MRERTIDIETADGVMPTFVTAPETGGPFAPVVLFMDVWGFREQLCDIARRIGTVGYAAIVPNLYYRKGGVTFDFRHPDGRTRSLKDLSKEDQASIYAVHEHLTDDMVIADCAALLDFFDGDADIRSGGPVGSIGWCMGGRHVIRAAAGHPDRFRATISLHPTRLAEGGDAAPYLDAPKCTGEVYIGYGERDHYTPPEVIETVNAAFGAAPVGFEAIVHKDAEHGYAIPDRDVFDKHAAARDWERAFAMYRRVLQP
ncbi:MAG: dienelactone hydrolase family protein [Alphaproteobacteria bacterium]|jgi:carboxymethylenebutenolidase